MPGLELILLDEQLSVCRLPPGSELPEWAKGEGLTATVTTSEELSVVCASWLVPTGLEVSTGWRALRVAGTLEHSLTGVLASLAAPLAEAAVPIFAISTFDTDYVLVPEAKLEIAIGALTGAGHAVEAEPPAPPG